MIVCAAGAQAALLAVRELSGLRLPWTAVFLPSVALCAACALCTLTVAIDRARHPHRPAGAAPLVLLACVAALCACADAAIGACMDGACPAGTRVGTGDGTRWLAPVAFVDAVALVIALFVRGVRPVPAYAGVETSADARL